MSAWRKGAVVVAILLLMGVVVAAEDLATARDLYAAAAYEDALVVLNQMRNGAHKPEEGRAIEQYRAFCLLALGRTADAEQAIEAVVAAEPSYQPSESEVSPRVRSAFRDVRRRMLPGIIQQQYAVAKAAFDKKDFVEATDRFTQVLAVIADPDVGPAAAEPPLSDLRVLASGFRDLSAMAAAPPPPPPAPEPPPPPIAPLPPSPLRIYQAGDADVVPPVAVRQTVPPYPSRPVAPAKGSVEIVIDVTGAVESATMKIPFNPNYDRLVLGAASKWLYRPATLHGVPVKFRKTVQISVER